MIREYKVILWHMPCEFLEFDFLWNLIISLIILCLKLQFKPFLTYLFLMKGKPTKVQLQTCYSLIKLSWFYLFLLCVGGCALKCFCLCSLGDWWNLDDTSVVTSGICFFLFSLRYVRLYILSSVWRCTCWWPHEKHFQFGDIEKRGSIVLFSEHWMYLMYGFF